MFSEGCFLEKSADIENKCNYCVVVPGFFKKNLQFASCALHQSRQYEIQLHSAMKWNFAANLP